MSAASTEVPQRKTSILLIVGIIFLPYIFSWFLLRKGHSKISRILGFGWLIIAIFIGFSGSKKPTPTPITSNPPSAIENAQGSTPRQKAQETVAPPGNPEQNFEKSLLKELEPLPPKWDKIEVKEASNTSYILNINYKESATFSGYEEISRDTKSIVRAALHVLMAQGRNPNKERIFVRAHAYQPAGVGETGVALTRRLGTSTYDLDSDQIKFQAPE